MATIQHPAHPNKLQSPRDTALPALQSSGAPGLALGQQKDDEVDERKGEHCSRKEEAQG